MTHSNVTQTLMRIVCKNIIYFASLVGIVMENSNWNWENVAISGITMQEYMVLPKIV